ncbi:MAG: hypothetical protein R2733_11710 [Acidimicrobiales bacterium]
MTTTPTTTKTADEYFDLALAIWPRPTAAADLRPAWDAAIARGETAQGLHAAAVEYVHDVGRRVCRNSPVWPAERFFAPTGDYRVYQPD